jgi:hypothetical protein
MKIVKIGNLVQLSVNQAVFRCYVRSNTPIETSITPIKKWVFIVCGHDFIEQSAYFYTQRDLIKAGNDIRGTIIVGSDLNPSGMNIEIYPFDGHLKDLRLFSTCLDPTTAIKYSR